MANGARGTYTTLASANPIRFATGGLQLDQEDLAVPAGAGLTHVRYFCHTAAANWAGPNGFNWWINTMPSVFNGGTSVAVTVDANNPYWFDLVGGVYVPRYGEIDVALAEDTLTSTFTFTHRSGSNAEQTVFNSFSASVAPGQFVSHTDSQGITTSVTSRSGYQVLELQRTYTTSALTVTESLVYNYFTSGTSTDNIQHVTYRRKIGSGSWDNISRASYVYYTFGSAFGVQNDLMSATRQVPDGSGGWNDVAVNHYRYYLGTESTGIFHGLKFHFGPEACRRIFNDGLDITTATDVQLAPYADHYFEYDPATAAVTKEVAAVCDSCPGGGTTADLFSYTANPRVPVPGFNVWSTRTEQTLPDGSKTIVYSNFAGLTMLMVTIDPTGTSQWCTFYRYNATGKVIWTAHPSAVTGYDDSKDDLLGFNSGTGLYTYLSTNSGLIDVTDYYTTTGSGAVTDYVQNIKVREGQSGSDVLIGSFTYTSHTDSNGVTVYPIATQTSYPDAGNASVTIVTSYAYTWYSGTNQMQTRTTTLPVVGTTQNGSGSAVTTIEQFDAFGNLTQFTDERGIVNTYTYGDAVLSAVTQQKLNVQTGITAPGVNITTDLSYDNRGRLIQTLGPSHTVVLSGTATTVRSAAWMVYSESIRPSSGTWNTDHTWSGIGYATGTNPSYTYTLIDPVSITGTDKNGRVIDQITSKRTTGSGALAAGDTFARSDWKTWSSTQYDAQGHTISQRKYFLIPSSGIGTAGTNYGQTDYGYDALERKNRVRAPGSTITRTVWTTPQRLASVWIGTDDTGATDSNPAGAGSPNNMVMVTANQYDGGNAGGDGNLTQVTQYASATNTRVTAYGYDFRNRRISMDGEVDAYAAYTYDNLNRLTQTDQYDTTASGNLVGRTQSKYDDRGRSYQQITYGVDPSTGTVGSELTSNTWFDASGNVLQQISAGDGSVFTKNVFNGAGWLTATYRGYNTSGTSHSQAGTVANDTIFAQSEYTFNEVGNVVSTASFDRLNDAPSTGTGSTGALTAGTDPKARVSYTATWYDGIDRPIASANYGAIASFTRPSTPPASSDTLLVSSTTYDDAGRVGSTADPAGGATQTSYDDASRVVQKVEAAGSAVERTTKFSYTLDSQISALTAVNPDTGDQVTTYTYGTTLAESDVARNDLLRFVDYPNSTLPGWSSLSTDDWADLGTNDAALMSLDPSADRVSYTYNRSGQQNTVTDQRGTTRTFLYDKLARLTDDCVTTVGSDTDDSVLRISTAYDVRGLVATTTSYDNATVGSGSALNQTKSTYNDFRQLIKEEQAHGGTVGTGTPSVQYGYDSGASNSNQIRPTSMTYPNGRVITYDYGTSGDPDDRLNRVAAIKDDSTTLAAYTYLGLS